MRTSRLVVIGLLGLFALTGCAGAFAEAAPVEWTDSDIAANTSADGRSVIGDGHSIQTAATFTANGGTAITYDAQVVPSGARAAISSQSDEVGTTVTLAVRGLLPNRTYGAHVHADACGPDANDAGPHFQNAVDPVQPSVDPAYANPQNEIWLDIETDADGAGSATSSVSWAFPDDRRPGSIVLHADPTADGPGVAGQAGGRVGCVSVEF
jgi:superoxide dismutase, Cu-Zn family